MEIKAKILIIEDDPNLGNTLTEYLSDIGHETLRASTQKEAVQYFESFQPNIVLMDVQLPDGNGFDLAVSLRSNRKDFVLLFLSAQNSPELRVQGLELGAQDYITKPFELKELRLKLDRIIHSQRDFFELPQTISHGPLKILFRHYEVVDAHGEATPLSQKECSILRLLYVKQGEVVDRDEIIDKVWGYDENPSSRTIDNYIVKLRKWSETDPLEHISIKSIRGVGYQLKIKDSK